MSRKKVEGEIREVMRRARCRDSNEVISVSSARIKQNKANKKTQTTTTKHLL